MPNDIHFYILMQVSHPDESTEWRLLVTTQNQWWVKQNTGRHQEECRVATRYEKGPVGEGNETNAA